MWRAIAPLVRCIDTMIEEEKEHYRCFAALNRACFPALYERGERYFSDLPWPMRALFGAVGLVAGRLAFALWYLMAMEESSTALARDMSPQSRHRDARRDRADLRGACTAST